MIDGAWGTGKSYFVKETLLPAVKKYEQERFNELKGEFIQHKFIYLSLYGISETEEISRLLFAELCKNFVQNEKHDNSKILSWIGAGTKILADVIKNNSGLDLQKAAEGITNKSLMNNCVLIFDDLERVCCDINEVLGYINNLVEQEGLKVLIIANEKEIDNRSRLINDPNELLFCLNDKIDYHESNDTNEDTEKISISKLEKRVNFIFPGNRNYRQIKEKLIGVTIKYCPNYYELLSTLTTKSVEDPVLRDIILSKKDRLYEIAKHYNHYNLRTILFFLSKFIELANSLANRGIIEEIVEYTFFKCIQVKTGDKTQDNQDDTSSAEFSQSNYIDIGIHGRVLGFKFIDDYIVSSRLIIDDINKEVDDYLSGNDGDAIFANSTAVKMQDHWAEMEESDIIKGLEDIIEKLGENRYPIAMYEDILLLFTGLTSIGFPAIYEEQVFELMKDRIINANLRQIRKFSENYHLGEPFIVETDRFFSKRHVLVSLINTVAEQADRMEIDSILKDKSTWGDKLDAFMYDKIKEDIKVHCLKLIDIDELLALIDESNSQNIHSFRHAVTVHHLDYDVEYYKDEYSGFQRLYDGLKQDNPSYDLIKRYNVNMLREEISRIMAYIVANDENMRKQGDPSIEV